MLSIVCIHCFVFENTFIRLIHICLYFITFVSRQKREKTPVRRYTAQLLPVYAIV